MHGAYINISVPTPTCVVVVVSSGMSKSCRRDGSGELDVFEAALYFSGAVNEASLIGIQRTRRVAERRSVDAPPSREAMEVIFQPLTKSESESKDKGERQPCPPAPGGKLANFIRSFFNQVISKKKASEYVEKHRKSTSRERFRKSTSLLSQRDDRSDKATKKCCYEKGCVVNARAAQPGEALIAKGEWYGKTEEEDGGGSDSSSDLFELQFTNSKSYLFQGP